MTKLNKPTGSARDAKASTYALCRTGLYAIIAAAGAASVAAAVFTVSQWTFEITWFKWVAMGLAALLAAGLAIMPPLIAYPFGEVDHMAIKVFLLVAAACFMFADGYFQMNAIKVGYKLAGTPDIGGVHAKDTAFIIGFQVATFFLGGLLSMATAVREEDLSFLRQKEEEARAKAMAAQAALAEERGKREAKNAGDRERRARDKAEAQRLGITVKEVISRRKAGANQPKLSVV